MWYCFAQQQRQMGYKVVAMDGDKAVSIYDLKTVYSLVKGSQATNLYLGTSKEFCIDYYSLTTEGRKELLLAYSYLPEDIISGGGVNSEVRVRKAILEGYEEL